MAARYLLRFDDICPGMNWTVWNRVESLLTAFAVKPLLAVVPDNRDANLNVEPPDAAFWEKVRGWQQRGWSIGLHGFQHSYTTREPGILGRNRYSEFAGLGEAEQRRKLEAGLAIFRENQVRPDAWIAPAHSFDRTTVRLLSDLGIHCISDGYALRPYVCGEGLLWVPQQLGRFRALPFGVWTVCQHVNGWSDGEIMEFRRDLERFRPGISNLGEMRNQYYNRSRNWSDAVFFACFRAARSLRG